VQEIGTNQIGQKLKFITVNWTLWLGKRFDLRELFLL